MLRQAPHGLCTRAPLPLLSRRTGDSTLRPRLQKCAFLSVATDACRAPRRAPRLADAVPGCLPSRWSAMQPNQTPRSTSIIKSLVRSLHPTAPTHLALRTFIKARSPPPASYLRSLDLPQTCQPGRANSATSSAARPGRRDCSTSCNLARASGCHGGLSPRSSLSAHHSQSGRPTQSGMYIAYSHRQHQ